ncbi:Inner membrane transport protein YieO [Salmonella enterica]|uniref:Inner membrane transport protein YieO n=1 Tax=Salmonella enterica TaxID=28901 RepID=A0A7D8IYA3_SALER|nr:Inner membrane transport protein YieO [Salmonella enterica]
MSTQFTAMNTITLADLTDDNASSGNSVLAVTQQLSISLGVAISAAVLRIYEGFAGTSTVEQFHYTFITMGGDHYRVRADVYAAKSQRRQQSD